MGFSSSYLLELPISHSGGCSRGGRAGAFGQAHAAPQRAGADGCGAGADGGAETDEGQVGQMVAIPTLGKIDESSHFWGYSQWTSINFYWGWSTVWFTTLPRWKVAGPFKVFFEDLHLGMLTLGALKACQLRVARCQVRAYRCKNLGT